MTHNMKQCCNKKKAVPDAAPSDLAAAAAGFEPSASFAGARPGMAFRSGPYGMGYYPDPGR